MKKRRGSRAIVIVLAAAAAALCVFFWFILRPGKAPAQKILGMWKGRGVEKPNVLLITLDTTRADHLACYGYRNGRTPAIDSLAARGIVFEECTSTSAFTLPAHCSIMTGHYPTFHGVRINGNTALPDQQVTLAEVFNRQGYQCGAFIGAFVLDGRWGLNQGFQHYDDYFELAKYKQLDLGYVQRPGNVVVDAALAWLEGRKEDPFFAWIHLYDPHSPYEPPEPYFSEYNKGPRELYDGEIAFTDEQVGRCISWLRKNGLDKKTIVVIVGDHGEGLGSHGELSHGFFIYDYAVQVPFLVVTPFDKLKGIRVAPQVRSVDIFPTLLDMAMIRGTENSQGTSLLPLLFRPEGGRDSYAYSESLAPNIQFGWGKLHSLRSTRYKFIDAPRPELYDLIRDPGESDNLTDKLPEIARDYRTALDNLIKETSLGAPAPEAANLDKETMERLATLGYLGAAASKKTPSNREEILADPKDKLSIFESVLTAGELIFQQKYQQAAGLLETVLKQDALVPQANLSLSTCYDKLGRREEAKTQLDLVLKDDPNNIPALIAMAAIFEKEGKKKDVIALCRRALSVDDRNTQAYTLIGEVYIAEKDHAQALPFLEKAVEIQPKLAQNRLNLAICRVGLRQYDRAESSLKEIIAQYPKFPLAYYHLGLLYEEQGRLEEARTAYSEEVALYPNHFRARFNLGKLLFKAKDLKGYLAQMNEIIKVAPQQAEGYLFLARGLLYESADLDRIRELIEKGLSLTREAELKAFGYFLLADVYTGKRQPDKVREALQKANSFKMK
jgi:arylsulfatase A-like enzyme/Tfp pilus assembly protein PilF